MSWLKKVMTSSIGLKLAVAVSGIGLVGFLVGHLYGNVHLYTGGAAGLDQYAHDLHGLPGFTLIELGLLGMFLVHIPLVILLARSNGGARPSRYAVARSKRATGAAQSLASRMMKLSGILMLLFIAIHVAHFRFERGEFHAADGSVSGLGADVIATLQNPAIAVLYVVGSLLTGWHVLHGFQSAFRSLGFTHTKYTPAIEKLGVTLAIVLGLGFASIPVAIQAGLVDHDAPAPDAAPAADDDSHGDTRTP